jgi:hypothetical protein
MMLFVQLTTLFFMLFTATSMPAAASINPNADAGDGRRYARSHRASILEGSGQIGMASYYWQPQRLASGGQFDPNAMTLPTRHCRSVREFASSICTTVVRSMFSSLIVGPTPLVASLTSPG